MNNENVQMFNNGNFKFSGASLNSLESSEYTLCTICLDTSLSISGFEQEMAKTIKSIIKSCQKSPRSDNLLIRMITFDVDTKEFHGFKELNKCNINDYNNIMNKLGGATCLFDATTDALEAMTQYSKTLFDSDYNTNSLFFVITDGENNKSSFTEQNVKEKMQEAVGEGKLESLVSILVGINTRSSGITHALEDFSKKAEFTQYIDIKDATPETLAKLAKFVSRSISSQSSSLGSGQSAPSLTF